MYVTGYNFKRSQEQFSLKPRGIPKFLTGETAIHGTSRIFPISEKFSKKLTPNGSGGSNFCLWPKTYIIKAKWLQNSELRMMDGILE